jgi:hypothetical protein
MEKESSINTNVRASPTDLPVMPAFVLMIWDAVDLALITFTAHLRASDERVGDAHDDRAFAAGRDYFALWRSSL